MGLWLLSPAPANVQQGLDRVSRLARRDHACMSPGTALTPPAHCRRHHAAVHCPDPQLTPQVAAWRARGRVPLGVDSTACLVEAQLHDRALSAATAAASGSAASTAAPPHHQQLPSESELRLQYGLAVVRMVNGITDSAQRGRVAASVASLASAAGRLDWWWVGVRVALGSLLRCCCCCCSVFDRPLLGRGLG